MYANTLEHNFIHIKGGINMEYKIIREREHFIIKDEQGKFLCSCENEKEVEEEIKEMEKTK